MQIISQDKKQSVLIGEAGVEKPPLLKFCPKSCQGNVPEF
jgi:hypothetical protein